MRYMPGQNAHEERVAVAEYYKKRIAELERQLAEAQAEIQALREQRDAGQWYPMQDDSVQADAERYRWLKANTHPTNLCAPAWLYKSARDFENPDDAIDAAIDAARGE